MLETFDTEQWQQTFSEARQQRAIAQLEEGSLLYFPKLSFELTPEERLFLTPHYADPRAKNISYQSNINKLWGVQHLTDEQHLQLKQMLARFCQSATQLVHALFPTYTNHLTVARTSYRPIAVGQRKTSYRKDDRRLHVDAFPSAPNQGKRILRVFSNINPSQEDRVWRIGEPFEQVANTFLPRLPRPWPGVAALLRFLKITKSYRSLYDHYMLYLHNHMKADEGYQQQAEQQELRLAAGSSWIVQTDHVSHAAMQGQYLLEQTFYLPVDAMQQQAHAPLRVLERLLQRSLI